MRDSFNSARNGLAKRARAGRIKQLSKAQKHKCDIFDVAEKYVANIEKKDIIKAEPTIIIKHI